MLTEGVLLTGSGRSSCRGSSCRGSSSHAGLTCNMAKSKEDWRVVSVVPEYLHYLNTLS